MIRAAAGMLLSWLKLGEPAPWHDAVREHLDAVLLVWPPSTTKRERVAGFFEGTRAVIERLAKERAAREDRPAVVADVDRVMLNFSLYAFTRAWESVSEAHRARLARNKAVAADALLRERALEALLDALTVADGALRAAEPDSPGWLDARDGAVFGEILARRL